VSDKAAHNAKKRFQWLFQCITEPVFEREVTGKQRRPHTNTQTKAHAKRLTINVKVRIVNIERVLVRLVEANHEHKVRSVPHVRDDDTTSLNHLPDLGLREVRNGAVRPDVADTLGVDLGNDRLAEVGVAVISPVLAQPCVQDVRVGGHAVDGDWVRQRFFSARIGEVSNRSKREEREKKKIDGS
jgi:hypothetical protein